MTLESNQNTARTNPVHAASKPNIIVQKSKDGWFAAIIISVILAGVLVVGAVFWAMKSPASDSKLAGVEKSKYQALFLTNGQVYFGKLAQEDSKTIRLNEIYYLQVKQPVQPKPDKPQDSQQRPVLVKLGQELHGPEDSMYVDRGQVLFYENLKNDSKVVKAIQDAKSKH